MRKHYPPGDEDIQNQKCPRSEHYLSHDLDDGDHPADGLLHLYPGPGVHLRKYPVHVVRRNSDASMEALLRAEVN